MKVAVLPAHFPPVNFKNRSATSANDEVRNIFFINDPYYLKTVTLET